MAAAKYNFIIEKGATFEKSITWKDASGNPINLAGYTAKMQLRDETTNTLVLELNTTNSGITFNTSYGQIILKILPADSLSITPKRLIYDLLLTDPQTNVKRLIQGTVKVSPTVTV